MSEAQIINPKNFGKHSALARKIQDALSELRPYLEADSGNISLVEITDDLVVKVQLYGSCVDCSMINMTMKGGVESAIKNVAPEITAIEAINILTDEINDLTINEVYSTNMPGKLLNSVISGPYLNRSAANNAKEKITKSGFDPRLRTLCKEN